MRSAYKQYVHFPAQIVGILCTKVKLNTIVGHSPSRRVRDRGGRRMRLRTFPRRESPLQSLAERLNDDRGTVRMRVTCHRAVVTLYIVVPSLCNDIIVRV